MVCFELSLRRSAAFESRGHAERTSFWSMYLHDEGMQTSSNLILPSAGGRGWGVGRTRGSSRARWDAPCACRAGAAPRC